MGTIELRKCDGALHRFDLEGLELPPSSGAHSVRIRSAIGRLECFLEVVDSAEFSARWEPTADVIDVEQLDPRTGAVLASRPGVALDRIARPLD